MYGKGGQSYGADYTKRYFGIADHSGSQGDACGFGGRDEPGSRNEHYAKSSLGHCDKRSLGPTEGVGMMDVKKDTPGDGVSVVELGMLKY